MDTDKKEQLTAMKKNLRGNIIYGAIIPLIIFYIFKHFNMTLTGIISSGAWSIAVVVVFLIKDRKVNVIALMTAIFSAIGLIGTIISKNPTYFLVSPIITRAIWAAMFLASLLFSRPLLQIIIESLLTFPEVLQSSRAYLDTWNILTIMWGIYQLTLASLLLILIHTVSIDIYFTIIMIGNLCDVGLILFCFWFAKWYMGKAGVVGAAN